MIYLSKIRQHWLSNRNQIRGSYRGYRISVRNDSGLNRLLEFNHEVLISISSIPWISKHNLHYYPNLDWCITTLWKEFNGVLPKT